MAYEPVLTLVFLAGGQCVLEEEDGEIIWASDEDTEFRRRFPDEFLNADQSKSVLEYLSEAGIVDEEELPEIEIEVESLEADDGEDDGDEEEPEDDEPEVH